MHWKIRLKVNKTDSSPISTIRIDADNLRAAYSEALSLYRMASILDYQEDGGPVTIFKLSDISAKSYPTNPHMFSMTK